jgi:TRAP-type C4-dicarboxylate transport system permease small subunit
MKRFARAIDKLSFCFGSLLAVVMLSALTFLVTLEVILRKVFATSTLMADEYAGYFFVGILYLGAAYTMSRKRHIVIDVVKPRLRWHLQITLSRVMCLINTTVFAILTYCGIDLVIYNFSRNIVAATVFSTPQYLPMLVIPIGMALLALQSVAEFIKTFLPQAPTAEVKKG